MRNWKDPTVIKKTADQASYVCDIACRKRDLVPKFASPTTVGSESPLRDLNSSKTAKKAAETLWIISCVSLLRKTSSPPTVAAPRVLREMPLPVWPGRGDPEVSVLVPLPLGGHQSHPAPGQLCQAGSPVTRGTLVTITIIVIVVAPYRGIGPVAPVGTTFCRAI